jgi:hypothetical protein
MASPRASPKLPPSSLSLSLDDDDDDDEPLELELELELELPRTSLRAAPSLPAWTGRGPDSHAITNETNNQRRPTILQACAARRSPGSDPHPIDRRA